LRAELGALSERFDLDTRRGLECGASIGAQDVVVDLAADRTHGAYRRDGNEFGRGSIPA
jgi:hypothetical protein